MKRSVLHWRFRPFVLRRPEIGSAVAAVELELRISSDWEPKPDVAAALLVEEPYPTRAIEIVAEVLWPEDKLGRS